MATTALGNKAVGSTVKIKVNGTLRDFLIVHKGRPSSLYDTSCDGVWLLMKDLYESRQWHSSNVNDYANSTIHSYLNSTFLNLIDANIRNQIKQVKIPYRPGSGTSGTVNSGANGLSCKIFLLSDREVGYTKSNVNQYICDDGAKLDYFTDGNGTNEKIAYLNGSAADWWLRSPHLSYSDYSWRCDSNGDAYGRGCASTYGIRPAFLLPSTLLVSDDGAVSTNTAPSTPGTLTIPTTINGGDSVTISWTASTDAESNLEGYELERSVNGGSSWSNVYKGNALSTTNTVPFGTESVMYRVRAYDARTAWSGYTTGPTRTVNNNTAPAITCASASGSDLGTKTAGFSVTYSVADADNDTITVKEKVDGTQKRSFTATPNAQNTFSVTGDTFMQLLNGTHALDIDASDGKASTVHKLTFTKSVTSLSITLDEPMEADAKITLCVLSVIGSIPADAEYKVEVTNNAKDTTPTWEDCTTAVKAGANYIFTNTATPANGPAFNFRITASRGESGTGGYVTSVQGGFQ